MHRRNPDADWAAASECPRFRGRGRGLYVRVMPRLKPSGNGCRDVPRPFRRSHSDKDRRRTTRTRWSRNCGFRSGNLEPPRRGPARAPVLTRRRHGRKRPCHMRSRRCSAAWMKARRQRELPQPAPERCFRFLCQAAARGPECCCGAISESESAVERDACVSSKAGVVGTSAETAPFTDTSASAAAAFRVVGRLCEARDAGKARPS